MIFGPNIKYFNELEINGKHIDDNDDEDYTAENEDPDVTDDSESENTTNDDDLTDYTEEEFDDESEDTDNDETEDVAENEDPDVTDDSESENTTNDDDLTDYTEEEFDDESEDTDNDETGTESEDGENTESENNAGDDLTDYTEEEFDDVSEDTDNDEIEDTAENEDGENTESNKDGGNETISDSDENTDTEGGNTLADMEKNLFSDLSPQQLSIKNHELLQNYIELYETINTVFDGINKIPKTFDNARTLSFIADQLVSLKDMVNYIITTTYITRTYVENMAYYKQALVILEQINTMLKSLIPKS